MAFAGFAHVSPLRQFIGHSQRKVIAQACGGEEGQFFIDKLQALHALIDAMPKTYEQDGKGDEAVAHLHYFAGGCDWYITEKDREDEQLQAFGLADFGDGGELGYIALTEITRCGAELDLHFEPQTLGQIRTARAGR